MAGDTSLLNRIREYDEDALAEAYDTYYEPIYRYVYRYLGRAGPAEDISANVFLRLLNAVRKGRCPRTNLSAWLYRVAHNLVVDTYRRKPAEELELKEWVQSSDPDILHVIEHRFRMDRVRLALRELTPSQRQVIALKFLQGMSSREVAGILDKTEGAVDALQHRALIALRKVLNKDQGPGTKGQPLNNELGKDKIDRKTGTLDNTLLMRALYAVGSFIKPHPVPLRSGASDGVGACLRSHPSLRLKTASICQAEKASPTLGVVT